LKRTERFECPFELALDTIAGRWRGQILWYLCEEEVLRFSDLRRRIPDITQKMLTQSLRALEDRGLVTRTVYPVVPPKVEYRITDLGKKLQPILKELQAWGREVAKANDIECIH